MSLPNYDPEKAVKWLIDHAESDAKAKAERRYIEEFRKSLKAIIQKEHVGESIAKREMEAYADPRYLSHLKAMQVAIFEDEKAQHLTKAAEIKLEVWRTAEATKRVLKV
jgi:hypothetical protein